MKHFLIDWLCENTLGLFPIRLFKLRFFPQAAGELFLDRLAPFGGLVGLRLQLPILAEKNLDFAFGFFQFLAAGRRVL